MNCAFYTYRYVFPEEEITLLHGNTANGLYLCFFCYLYDSSAIPSFLSGPLIWSVIDEIDAFPYNGDAGLAHAVQTAIKPERTIHLLKVPHLIKRLLKGKSSRRFDIHTNLLYAHRRLLPEPVLVFMNNWRQNARTRRR